MKSNNAKLIIIDQYQLFFILSFKTFYANLLQLICLFLVIVLIRSYIYVDDGKEKEIEKNIFLKPF